MTWLLWAYLGGVAAYVYLGHGILQSPKCESGACPSAVMASAIIWPILVLAKLVMILMGKSR